MQLVEGDVFRFGELAEALERFGAEGAEPFYRGDIAAAITSFVVDNGGTRLLGRVLPVGRGWRLAIVTLAALGFVIWVFYFAGTELAHEAARLRLVLTVQGEEGS